VRRPTDLEIRRAGSSASRQGTWARRAVAAVATALAFAAVDPSPAGAASPYLVTPDATVAERTPAYRYANMTDAEAFAELDKRKIIYQRLGAVTGVRAPVKLTGRLHGVWFHSSLPPEQRVSSSFEILDARLALALDDFAAILERHDIDEVIHFTMYRPNGERPDGVHEGDEHAAPAVAEQKQRGRKVAQRRRPGAKEAAPPDLPSKGTGKKQKADRTVRGGKQKGSTQKGRPPAKARGAKAARGAAPAARAAAARASFAAPGTRHPAGLAIDVGGLRKKDGRWLSVGWHFQGKIGDKTCGEGARLPESPESRELRSIVCEAADLGIFTYVLTPNYNAAHSDHYHMEIKPGVRWFLYH
jgi:hypothetical protein